MLHTASRMLQQLKLSTALTVLPLRSCGITYIKRIPFSNRCTNILESNGPEQGCSVWPQWPHDAMFSSVASRCYIDREIVLQDASETKSFTLPPGFSKYKAATKEWQKLSTEDSVPSPSTGCYSNAVKNCVQLDTAESLSDSACNSVKRDGFVLLRTSVADAFLLESLVRAVIAKCQSDCDSSTIEWMGYNGQGGVSRSHLFGEKSSWISAADGAPKELTVEFHNEMAYAQAFPQWIAFGMFESQVQQGGHTMLVDNWKIVQDLCEASETSTTGIVWKKLSTLGVTYLRRIRNDLVGDDKPQQLAVKYPYLVSGKEAFCDVNNNCLETLVRSVNQRSNESLEIISEEILLHKMTRPAVYKNKNGRLTLVTSLLNFCSDWFDRSGSHKHAAVPEIERPYSVTWGDNNEWSAEEARVIRELHEKHAVLIKLKQGDVLFLDNTRTQHGRESYVGQRTVGILMSTPKEHQH